MIPLGISEFRPHPLLRSGHVQTLAAIYLPMRRIPYRAVQHQVQLTDGDWLVLHDDCPSLWRPRERIALLIHGLGGCHGSPYLVRIAARLNQQGVRTFRLDLRGCGAGVGLARRPFHAGRSEDAAAALEHLARLCPDSPVTLLGFSLGGNIVLKLLGESGEDPPGHLDSAMAVCPPIDLATCCRNLEQGWGRFYDRAFARGVWRHLQRNRQHFADISSESLGPAPRRLIEFDARFTAPLGGFDSVDDYYATSSAGPRLSRICLPTLILAAADDPVVPATIFSGPQYSPAITLHLSPHGGHLGFLGIRGNDPDRRWMDWRLIQWLLAVDQASNKKAKVS